METQSKELFAIQVGISALSIGIAMFRNKPAVLVPLTFGTLLLSGASVVLVLSHDDSKPEKKEEKESVSSEGQVVPTFSL